MLSLFRLFYFDEHLLFLEYANRVMSIFIMSEVPLLSEFENVKRKSRNNKYDRASFRQKSISRTVLFFILVGAFVVSVRTIWIRLNRTKLDRIVELDVGKIQGVTITKGGVEADYFLSIPFAEPPIGDNRFEISSNI